MFIYYTHLFFHSFWLLRLYNFLPSYNQPRSQDSLKKTVSATNAGKLVRNAMVLHAANAPFVAWPARNGLSISLFSGECQDANRGFGWF